MDVLSFALHARGMVASRLEQRDIMLPTDSGCILASSFTANKPLHYAAVFFYFLLLHTAVIDSGGGRRHAYVLSLPPAIILFYAGDVFTGQLLCVHRFFSGMEKKVIEARLY